MRKPGAFAQYRYREDLFPRVIFRVAYDLLHEAHPATADRRYIRLLELAATQGEGAVAEVLRELITRGEPVTPESVATMISIGTPLVSTASQGVTIVPVVLAAYDALLRSRDQEVQS